MPSYEEFVYQGGGRTERGRSRDTRTLEKAKAEKMDYICQRYMKHIENGSDLRDLQPGRISERGVTLHDIRNAQYGRAGALRSQRILDYDAALYTRKAQYEAAVEAATTNAEVDAVHVDFHDITYSG